MAEKKTKARLTMVGGGNSGLLSYFVIESDGAFASAILEEAVDGKLPQYNLNPPFVILGEDVPEKTPVTEPSRRATVAAELAKGDDG